MDELEKLADLEHQQWAHWTKYMLDNLTEENIKRWRKQIDTPYGGLSEKEKESDREWARKALDVIKGDGMKTLRAKLVKAGMKVEAGKIKCPECGMSVPDVPEDATYDEKLCNKCYEKLEKKMKKSRNK